MYVQSRDFQPIHLEPIGQVCSDLKIPMPNAEEAQDPAHYLRQLRDYHKTVRYIVCELRILPQWEALLKGIEAFSHILVLFWAHRIDPQQRIRQQVHPMGRREIPKQGIFATCSPTRPNPVLTTVASLLERDGTTLRVKGLDALDGSPLIDIKPFVPHKHGAHKVRLPDWMVQIHRDLNLDMP